MLSAIADLQRLQFDLGVDDLLALETALRAGFFLGMRRLRRWLMKNRPDGPSLCRYGTSCGSRIAGGRRMVTVIGAARDLTGIMTTTNEERIDDRPLCRLAVISDVGEPTAHNQQTP